MSEPTNPPAFPVTYEHAEVTAEYHGMTLRDYFAAKAMHGELITCGVPGKAADALIKAAHSAKRTPEEQIAFNAYELADAMLRARQKQS